jgi:osmotically-inducible protein OsmY
LQNSRDDAITGGIIAAFAASPRIHSTEIRIYTHNGLVRLQGIVETLEEKLAAEETAAQVAGVRGIENDLTVSADKDIPDLELQRMSQRALNNAGLAGIGAEAEAGTIFLMGQVASRAVEERAMDTVRAISGVRDVISNLEIAAGVPIDDIGIADNVVAVLSEDPSIVFYNLDVRAHDGRITITGDVDTEDQWKMVTEIAESVPGVKSVENRMSIVETAA